MDKSLTDICKQYFKVFLFDAAPEDYFFHSENGTCYLNNWASKWMYIVLEQAGLDRNVNPENGRGRALHTLRHTFAVNSLRKQQADGVDRYYAVPILSTYMGHDDIYGTELYLQMTADVSIRGDHPHSELRRCFEAAQPLHAHDLLPGPRTGGVPGNRYGLLCAEREKKVGSL